MTERQVSHRSFVSYIDKSRGYYAAHGYEQPYRWAAFDDVPFAPLTTPLAESRVAVVTTSFPHDWSAAPDESPTTAGPKTVYNAPNDPIPEAMFTEDLSWDKDATHTRDTETFLPLLRLQELTEAGRIGEVNHRFFGVPTEYSQRRTGVDAASILDWCRADDVDVVLLVPI